MTLGFSLAGGFVPDIPKTSEYWTVECDECDQWIAIRPASRMNDILIKPTVPFPAKFTVAGHNHSGFLGSEVFPEIRTSVLANYRSLSAQNKRTFRPLPGIPIVKEATAEAKLQ